MKVKRLRNVIEIVHSIIELHYVHPASYGPKLPILSQTLVRRSCVDRPNSIFSVACFLFHLSTGKGTHTRSSERQLLLSPFVWNLIPVG